MSVKTSFAAPSGISATAAAASALMAATLQFMGGGGALSTRGE